MTDAYRKYLTHACASLQQVVSEIASGVPGELSRATTLDLSLRSARLEAAEALGRYPADWTQGFEESLAKLVDGALALEGSRPLDLDSLAIMDDERVHEEVEVVNAGRLLADDAGLDLRRLQWIESTLRIRQHAPNLSPVDPASIGRALWRATERLPLSLAARSEAVRSAVRLLGPRLGPLYRDLAKTTERAEGIAQPTEAPFVPASGTMPPRRCRRQRAAGSVVGARRPSAAGTCFDATHPGVLIDLTDRRIVHHASNERASEFLVTQPLALEGDGASVPRLIHHHRDELAMLGTPGATCAAISLIGRIFDEILADPALDAEAAPWIGRLQPAVLKLASQDAELLQSHRHPAWALINQLATLFSEEVGRRPPNLVAWLNRVVSTLQSAPHRERFDAINRKLSAWRSAQAQSRLTEMAPTVGFLRRHAQLEEGVEAARKCLERRLDASRADEAVRRFVASVWALVCAQEVSAGPRRDVGRPDAWDTATDLMWSTSPARSCLDAPTLVQMIPGLVDRLKEGMGRLGLDPSVRGAWLERLSALHLRALRRAAEEAQTDAPMTIDLVLEDELPPPGERIEAPIESALPTTPSDDPVEAMAIGQRLAMRVQGSWTEAALVWRSDNGQFLLFAVTAGGTVSVTRRSFQRLLDEDLARLQDAGGALARAARRIAGIGRNSGWQVA